MEVIPWSKPSLNQEDFGLVERALKSTWISGGTYIEELEYEFSNFIGEKYAISVNNGTSALYLAFASLGLKPGAEVILPSFGFMAAANVAINMGLRPIFSDVNIHTWCIDADSIEKVITSKTKAIVIIHSYGNMSDLEEIRRICAASKVRLIEDAAESLGSADGTRMSGTNVDIGTYSFHATKLITSGEGGMIVTPRVEIAKQARLFRSHGLKTRGNYDHLLPGLNFRMTNFQAALAVSQLRRVNTFISERITIRNLYLHLLQNAKSLLVQSTMESVQSVPWAFPVRVLGISRSVQTKIVTRMKLRGVEVRPGFTDARNLSYLRNISSFPNSSTLSREIISLPLYPGLREEQVRFISKVFLEEIDATFGEQETFTIR